MLALLVLSSCGGHGRARELLSAKKYQPALEAIRGQDGDAQRLRAMAWRGLKRPRKARLLLLRALALDERDAMTLRLLAQVEVGLGLLGAALRHLERAVALQSDEKLREALARLLWLRGALRFGPQDAKPGRDFMRAHALARGWPASFDFRRWVREVKAQPELVCEREARTGGAPHPSSRPASSPRSYPTSHVTSSKQRGCDLEEQGAVLRRAFDGELLLACVGERLLARFDRAQCPSVAIDLAEKLRRESPHDPRWPLALARAYWLGGRPERSAVLLEEHLYLSKTRALGALRVARMLLEFGARRRAAAWAVRALAFAGRGPWRGAALEVLRVSGYPQSGTTPR